MSANRRGATRERSDSEAAAALNAAGYRPNATAIRQRFGRDALRTILANRFYVGELPVGKEGLENMGRLFGRLWDALPDGIKRKLEQKVAKGVEAQFEFTADQKGSFEVESHTTDKVLVVLQVG